MRKRMTILGAAIIMLCNGMPVCAAPTNDEKTVSITISPDGVSVDDTGAEEDSFTEEQDPSYDKSVDYEEVYKYDGEDYIYAKVSFGGDEYAVPRTKYGDLLNFVYSVGFPESNVSNFISAEEEKKQEPVLPPSKDTRAPWNSYTAEDWENYSAFASSFVPDEWQKKLLEYYNLVEIYAYYMGGYTIDEEAYKAYTEGETAAVPDEANSETEIPVSYSKIVIESDLFSVFDHSEELCITNDNSDAVYDYLSEFDEFSEDTDVTNPNAFSKGEYYFEIGTEIERVTEYTNIKKDKATSAIKFINSKKIADYDPLNEYSAEIYSIRICTLSSNNKKTDKIFYLEKKDAMKLISNYLGSNNKNNVQKETEVPLQEGEVIPKG